MNTEISHQITIKVSDKKGEFLKSRYLSLPVDASLRFKSLVCFGCDWDRDRWYRKMNDKTKISAAEKKIIRDSYKLELEKLQDVTSKG